MNKPHLRKVESPSYEDRPLWHCSLLRSTGRYWHEYGYTWQGALDKMMARLARHGQ